MLRVLSPPKQALACLARSTSYGTPYSCGPLPHSKWASPRRTSSAKQRCVLLHPFLLVPLRPTSSSPPSLKHLYRRADASQVPGAAPRDGLFQGQDWLSLLRASERGEGVKKGGTADGATQRAMHPAVPAPTVTIVEHGEANESESQARTGRRRCERVRGRPARSSGPVARARSLPFQVLPSAACTQRAAERQWGSGPVWRARTSTFPAGARLDRCCSRAQAARSALCTPRTLWLDGALSWRPTETFKAAARCGRLNKGERIEWRFDLLVPRGQR